MSSCTIVPLEDVVDLIPVKECTCTVGDPDTSNIIYTSWKEQTAFTELVARDQKVRVLFINLVEEQYMRLGIPLDGLPANVSPTGQNITSAQGAGTALNQRWLDSLRESDEYAFAYNTVYHFVNNIDNNKIAYTTCKNALANDLDYDFELAGINIEHFKKSIRDLNLPSNWENHIEIIFSEAFARHINSIYDPAKLNKSVPFNMSQFKENCFKV